MSGIRDGHTTLDKTDLGMADPGAGSAIGHHQPTGLSNTEVKGPSSGAGTAAEVGDKSGAGTKVKDLSHGAGTAAEVKANNTKLKGQATQPGAVGAVYSMGNAVVTPTTSRGRHGAAVPARTKEQE